MINYSIYINVTCTKYRYVIQTVHVNFKVCNSTSVDCKTHNSFRTEFPTKHHLQLKWLGLWRAYGGLS